jgi:hypothetical protein
VFSLREFAQVRQPARTSVHGQPSSDDELMRLPEVPANSDVKSRAIWPLQSLNFFMADMQAGIVRERSVGRIDRPIGESIFS